MACDFDNDVIGAAPGHLVNPRFKVPQAGQAAYRVDHEYRGIRPRRGTRAAMVAGGFRRRASAVLTVRIMLARFHETGEGLRQVGVMVDQLPRPVRLIVREATLILMDRRFLRGQDAVIAARMVRGVDEELGLWQTRWWTRLKRRKFSPEMKQYAIELRGIWAEQYEAARAFDENVAEIVQDAENDPFKLT